MQAGLHASNPGIWKVGTSPLVQGQTGQQSEFQARKVYIVRCYLKSENINKAKTKNKWQEQVQAWIWGKGNTYSLMGVSKIGRVIVKISIAVPQKN